jgi:protein-L-isoaspartate(D-aspartate) O-methyltransferase
MKVLSLFPAIIAFITCLSYLVLEDVNGQNTEFPEPESPTPDGTTENPEKPPVNNGSVPADRGVEKSKAYGRAKEREAMVKTQLAGRDIVDMPLLDAMRRVPRHLFIPAKLRRKAYQDHPVPIGLEQTISQPYIVAFMTQVLKLQKDDRVLEIGTGSGYQAAILGELVKEVWTMEIIPELGDRSKKLLAELGYKNIKVRVGDGYQGWPDQAPFDAVIVTAAPPKIPRPLLEQLKIGGRMIIPVGNNRQELVLIRRTEQGYERRRVLPVSFVPMTGEAQGKPRPGNSP